MATAMRIAGTTPGTYTANPPAIPIATYVLLATVPANPLRAGVEVQNQSAATIQLVRDDGSPNAQASILLTSGGGAGIAGASWFSDCFQGRVLIYGPAGSQIAAWED